MYILDLISSANLSESYFTNRQDRYVAIRDCPPMANFFQELVSCVSDLSFQLQADDTVQLLPDLQHHPYQGRGNGEEYRALAKHRITQILDPSRNNDWWLKFNSRTRSLSDSILDPEKENISTSVSDTPHASTSQDDSRGDTWIYPLIQMGPFGIDVDDRATQTLFQTAPDGANIHLASGYFNLTEHYMENIISESRAEYDILTASPEVSYITWGGGGGLCGF